MLLSACASGPPAPVLDRSSGYRSGSGGANTEVHVVRRGDTLYSIAFRYNLDHRTLAAWNAIGPPYTIYPDQVLWLQPPSQQKRRSRPADRRAAARSETSPPATNTAAPAASRSAQRNETPNRSRSQPPAPGKTEPVVVPPKPAKNVDSERLAADVNWVWPVAGGRVNRSFVAGDKDQQGIDIGGRAGQPVVAAAAGEVVYSGPGFVGFAGLIIIKHNDTLLSAYAHNRRRQVAEGDRVKAGQQIAELGQSPRGEDEVYVQIRRNGVPQDPLDFLPAR